MRLEVAFFNTVCSWHVVYDCPEEVLQMIGAFLLPLVLLCQSDLTGPRQWLRSLLFALPHILCSVLLQNMNAGAAVYESRRH